MDFVDTATLKKFRAELESRLLTIRCITELGFRFEYALGNNSMTDVTEHRLRDCQNWAAFYEDKISHILAKHNPPKISR